MDNNDNWFEDESENSEIESLTDIDYDITSVPNDFNIGTLYSFIESGIVKIPDFQRNFVWDKKRASKLIESILIGLPIPQLFFYETENNSYLIIDGQQRLLSIYFFIKQRFPKDDARAKIREEFELHGKIREEVLSDDQYFTDFKLALDNNKSIYYAKKFTTLEPIEAKAQFQHMRFLRTVIIRQNSPNNGDSSMFEIFNRLNTGGQNLSAQEIRLSLYYSKFYFALNDLNKDPIWRNLLQNNISDIHAKDIEFLLRVFALTLEYNNYSQPMKKFLNEFSKKSKKFNDDAIEYCKNLFKSFLSACSELELENAFVKNGKFSITLFDAVFVAICIDKVNKRDLIKNKINKFNLKRLKEDKNFNLYCQFGTTDAKNVVGRILLAQKYLLGNIDE